MDLGYIDNENLDVFKSLILPSVVSTMQQGRPVIAWGVTEKRIAIAALTAVVEEYTLVVTSYYVSTEYRHMGAGKLLLQELEAIARKHMFGVRIQFAAISDEHKELVSFLEKHGYENDANLKSAAYEIPLEKVFSYPLFNKKVNYKLSTFSEVPSSILKRASNTSMSEGRPIPEGGFLSNNVDKEVSMLYVDGRDVLAYLTYESTMPGVLVLSAAWNKSKDFTMFFKLIQESAGRIRQKYSSDTMLIIRVINGETSKLMKYLLPDMSCISYDFRKVRVV